MAGDCKCSDTAVVSELVGSLIVWAWIGGIAVLGFALMVHLGIDKHNMHKLEKANQANVTLTQTVADLKATQKDNLATIENLRIANDEWRSIVKNTDGLVDKLKDDLKSETMAHENSKQAARAAMARAANDSPEWRDTAIPGAVTDQLCSTSAATCSNQDS